MANEQIRTVYQGGKIVLTDDLEVDADTYTLKIVGNVEFVQDGETMDKPASVVYVDAQDAELQSQIDALIARVDALENPV